MAANCSYQIFDVLDLVIMTTSFHPAKRKPWHYLNLSLRDKKYAI